MGCVNQCAIKVELKRLCQNLGTLTSSPLNVRVTRGVKHKAERVCEGASVCMCMREEEGKYVWDGGREGECVCTGETKPRNL